MIALRKSAHVNSKINLQALGELDGGNQKDSKEAAAPQVNPATTLKPIPTRPILGNEFLVPSFRPLRSLYFPKVLNPAANPQSSAPVISIPKPSFSPLSSRPTEDGASGQKHLAMYQAIYPNIINARLTMAQSSLGGRRPFYPSSFSPLESTSHGLRRVVSAAPDIVPSSREDQQPSFFPYPRRPGASLCSLPPSLSSFHTASTLPSSYLWNAPGLLPGPQKEGKSRKEKAEGKSEEDSWSAIIKPQRNKKLFEGNAYKRRNVYKSIVRHTFSYMRKNRDEVIGILREAGFEIAEIEHAFVKISFYNDMERQKGNPKKSQSIIKKIINKRTIYTYLLREALNAMIKNWGQGKVGKISAANCEVYKEVCTKLFNETVGLTGENAKGVSSAL